MDMTGEFRIPAQREEVWKALNDPRVLEQCIPGCESLEQVSENEFAGKINSKIGPVKATFDSKVLLENINPPASYTLSGEGKGGAAGFAKGSADVTLTEDGGETVLNYAARIQPGGKLAQVGSRLIGGTVRKLADEFFSNFNEYMNPQAAGSSGGEGQQAQTMAASEQGQERPSHGSPAGAGKSEQASSQTPMWWWWAGGAVLLVGVAAALTAL